MENIVVFFCFLLLTGSLFFLAKFILEDDEFRYVRALSPLFAVLAGLMFWGFGELDPVLSTTSRFLVSGAVTLLLIIVLHALRQRKKRPLVALLLALISTSLAIPFTLFLLWLLFTWFPSTFFTPPPTRDYYESRLMDTRYGSAPTRKAGTGPRVAVADADGSTPTAVSSAKPPLRNVTAYSGHGRTCPRRLPALHHRA